MRPEFLAAVPFDASFCQFVLRDGVFRTDDSAADTRLKGHPYQGVVVSYHSVPLMSDAGEPWGTLSHFDMASLPLSDDEFELLKSAAKLMPSFLVEH